MRELDEWALRHRERTDLDGGEQPVSAERAGISTRELVTIVERLEHPILGVCLDPANSVAALEMPEPVIERLAPHVVNLHVKDFAFARREGWVGFTLAGRPLGEGLLDVDAMLGALRAHRRDPNAIVELWVPHEQRELEREWAESSLAALRARLAVNDPQGPCQARFKRRIDARPDLRRVRHMRGLAHQHDPRRCWPRLPGRRETPKNGRPRVVTVPPPASAALRDVPTRLNSPYLFHTTTGKRLSKGMLSYNFRVVRQRWAKRDRFELCELRHACATLLMERGLPPHVVANQLGHSDGGSLAQRLYGHPAEKGMREQVRVAFAEWDASGTQGLPDLPANRDTSHPF